MSFVSPHFPFLSVPLWLCAGSSFAIISQLLRTRFVWNAAVPHLLICTICAICGFFSLFVHPALPRSLPLGPVSM